MKKTKTNLKEYYNEKLNVILSNIITYKKYGEWTLLIKEIFQRRAYEFGFSNEQIAKEAECFARNVDKIEIVSYKKMINKNVVGAYNSNKSKILLSRDYFIKNYCESNCLEDIFETLTHEVYHAISNNNICSLGLSYYDRIEEKWKGNAINEAFVETAADRASFSRTPKDAEHYRRRTTGYSNITFTTNLLAASIGFSEKKILNLGLQDRQKLEDTIMQKAGPNNRNHIWELLKKYEGSLDIIYNILYEKANNLPKKDIKTKEELMKSSLITLYKTAFEIACHQISQDERPLDSKYLAEISYRYLKMETIFRDSLEDFVYYRNIKEDIVSDIYDETADARKMMSDRVIGLRNILKSGSKIKDSNDRENLIKCTKAGINNIDLLIKYRLPIPKGSFKFVYDITGDIEFSRYIMKEDFDLGKKWNNEDIDIILKKIFMRDLKKNRINLDSSHNTETDLSARTTKQIQTIDLNIKRKPETNSLEKTQEFLPVEKDNQINVFNKKQINEVPALNNRNGIFSRIKNIVSRMVKKVGNRNSSRSNKTDFYDNSEYYANLVTNNLNRKEENELDKYIVDIVPTISYNSENVKNRKTIKKTIEERND